VVHPVKRHRWRIRDPDGLERVLLSFPPRRHRALDNLIPPGILGYLVSGPMTESGGAWIASIVAEYLLFKGPILDT